MGGSLTTVGLRKRLQVNVLISRFCCWFILFNSQIKLELCVYCPLKYAFVELAAVRSVGGENVLETSYNIAPY